MRALKLSSWVVGFALVVSSPVHAAHPQHQKAKVKTKTQAASVDVRKTVQSKAQSKRLSGRKLMATTAAAAMVTEVPRQSFGMAIGLHETPDPLELKSSVALVVDQDTSEVLFSKNPQAVLPIASLTKLMTAMVVVDAQQPLDEMLEISAEDIDTEKNSRSRLKVGSVLSRKELLHLALMSSENRAAHALGRYYPGGLPALVVAMNRKAAAVGMVNSRYVEPTGLSSDNQSTASDLARLVKVAYSGYPLLREFTTSPEYEVDLGSRILQFHNTNRLVTNPNWEIGLQKTGYIVEAGRCLVMQARLAGRKLIMVFLDSAGKYSRLGDAERVKRWLEAVESLQPVRHDPIKVRGAAPGPL